VTPLLISCWAMAGVVVGFTLASGVSLSDLAGTYSRHFFSAVGMHANDLGRLYAVAYALLLFVWDRSTGISRKLVLLATMGAVVMALLLTFSRGAFLGFILVNIIYLFSCRNRKVMLLALLLVPIALYLMPGAVMSRMEMGFGSGANEVSAGRVEDIWAPLMPEIFDHPFFGNGLGAVMWAKAMVHQQMFQVGHPHNAFLQLYLDMGIVGFILIMGFWGYAWRTFRKLGKDARVAPELQGVFHGAAAGLVSFIVAGMAGSSFEPAPEQAFLWLAIGVMFGIQAKLAAAAAPAARQR
jgi:O-antigen ligase